MISLSYKMNFYIFWVINCTYTQNVQRIFLLIEISNFSADEGDGGTDQGRRKSKSKKKKKESFSSGAEQETSQTPNMLQVVDKNR